METSNPDLDYARKFAEGIHAKFPGKMLAYNCSPSFNGPQNYQLLKWKRSARILLQWDTNSIHYFSWISRAKYKYV
jgi:isocitrate lyase